MSNEDIIPIAKRLRELLLRAAPHAIAELTSLLQIKVPPEEEDADETHEYQELMAELLEFLRLAETAQLPHEYFEQPNVQNMPKSSK